MNGASPPATTCVSRDRPTTAATWSAPFSPHHDGTKTEHGFASLFDTGGGLGLVWLDGRAMKPGTGPDDEGTGDMGLRAAHFRSRLETTVGGRRRSPRLRMLPDGQRPSARTARSSPTATDRLTRCATSMSRGSPATRGRSRRGARGRLEDRRLSGQRTGDQRRGPKRRGRLVHRAERSKGTRSSPSRRTRAHLRRTGAGGRRRIARVASMSSRCRTDRRWSAGSNSPARAHCSSCDASSAAVSGRRPSRSPTWARPGTAATRAWRGVETSSCSLDRHRRSPARRDGVGTAAASPDR